MEQLLDSLRQQLLERVGTTRTGNSEATSADKTAPGRRTETLADLRKRIAREMQAYDLASAEGRKRARISFLESVLIWDLGDGIVRDPKFLEFTQGIEALMGEDSKMGERLDEVLAALVRDST